MLVALLVGLVGSVGLGVAGWLVGLGYVAGLLAVLWGATARQGHRLGPADRITLIRAVLLGAVAALTADRFAGLSAGKHPDTAAFAVWLGLAIFTLVLDAVDGPVGRRTATASRFGARFDMEVDAFVILVLSVAVATDVGCWALAIGAMRYAFVAATWLFPRLAVPLPPSTFRKAVAASQGILLLLAAGAQRWLPFPALGVGLVAVALTLLTISFGRDTAWLSRNRTFP